jgi:four helix bundle protein
MIQAPNTKRYDLEERTLAFAQEVNRYVRGLPRDIANQENGKQLVRAAGSVGANYIEANESLSRKDFCMRVKISKKECKEARYWLVPTQPKEDLENSKDDLIGEATQLMKIFGAILEKSGGRL